MSRGPFHVEQCKSWWASEVLPKEPMDIHGDGTGYSEDSNDNGSGDGYGSGKGGGTASGKGDGRGNGWAFGAGGWFVVKNNDKDS